MARYIDADELIKNIARINDLRRLSTKTIGEAISKTPTADVVEVKHGEWEVCSDEYEICANEFVCSICKESFVSSELTDEEFFKMMKYCPECGAKMDGGTNER